MNQELLDFIYDILQQLIAGIPIGTILSLVVYYALNKVKAKTAEFPAKAQDLENQVKTFADKVVAVSTELRNNVVSVVNAELDKFSKKADEYQLVIDGYHKQLEEAEKTKSSTHCSK